MRSQRLALLLTVMTASGCHRQLAPERCDSLATPGTTTSCALAGWSDRAYDIHLPPGWSPDSPVPVVLVFHGGGGSRESAASLTCPSEPADGSGCLDALADREGFAVVYPDGTSARTGRRLRTWNAGGGSGEWQCVSGRACGEGVDDVAFVVALLDDLERWMRPDPKRIFATGLSNGAAMSHRLACELSARIAAIAPVAGGNQLAEAQGCLPERPVPVLQIHGTADPCWSFEGGPAACLQDDGKSKASIPATVADWAQRNGCGPSPTVEHLPDLADDGTRVQRESYPGCRADVVLLRIVGGGHTWPDGKPYFSSDRVGVVCRDVNGNEAIWQFFASHPMQ